MSDPIQTADRWSRDEVIKLLKNYAGGADFTEPLIRKVCKEAFRLLHRERGAENVHFSPKGGSKGEAMPKPTHQTIAAVTVRAQDGRCFADKPGRRYEYDQTTGIWRCYDANMEEVPHE